jgi:anti-anti-sigma factor
MATVTTVDEVLAAALAEAREQIILDLRGLEFIDSSGLNLVYRFDQRARENGRSFSVVLVGQTRRAFELAGLDRRLSLVESPGEPESPHTP